MNEKEKVSQVLNNDVTFKILEVLHIVTGC